MSNQEYDDLSEEGMVQNTEDDFLDDFSDDESLSSSEDDVWDEVEDDVSASYNDPPPKKKKGFLGNLLIVVVVLICSGLFVMYKFGGNGSGVSPVPVSPSVETADDVSPSSSGAPSPVTVLSQGEAPPQPPSLPPSSGPLIPMPDEVTLAKGAETVTTSPAPSDMSPDSPPLLLEEPSLMTAPETPLEEASDVSGQENQEVVAQKPSVALEPVSDFPSADMIKKMDSPSSVPNQSQSPEEQDSGSSQELQAALDQIRELRAAIEKNDQVVENYKEQVDSLEGTVSDLTAKLEEARKSVPPAVGSPKSDVAESVPLMPEERKESFSKRFAPSVDMEEGKEAVASISADHWALKGAQSGRALLTEAGNSQADIRTVSVGDRVQGLGTILSIEKGQSGWVVLGTLGKVTE